MSDDKTFPHKLYNDAQLQPIEAKTEDIKTPETEKPEEEKPEETGKEALRGRFKR